LNAELYVSLFVAIFLGISIIVVVLLLCTKDAEPEKKFEDLTVEEKVKVLADLIMKENADDD
jgi:hypothetical protein